MTREPSPSADEQEGLKRVWGYLAAVAVGIAIVLLFFIFFGIPRSFESFAHRNNPAWQERNNPTTTTTVPEPLTDELEAKIQTQLDEVVAELAAWNAIAHASWDSLSEDMQNFYSSSAAYWGPVTDHLACCAEVASFWPNIFQGAMYHEYKVGAEPGWNRGSLENTARAERIQLELIGLVRALETEVDAVTLSLLAATRYEEYYATDSDRALIRSWEETRHRVADSLEMTLGIYDMTLLSWYLAKG